MGRAFLGLLAFAAVLAAPSVGMGEDSGVPLGISRAKLRLHRDRGAARDRMKLRARFETTPGSFDPRFETLDLLVQGIEVLCIPGSYQLPPPYEGPAPQDPTPGAREWTLRERAGGHWIYRTEGRRVDLGLWEGTIRVSGRDLDLDVLPGDGPEDVDVTLVLGDEPLGTVVDFEEHGRVWTYVDR